jgi:hypothetical protein
MGLLKRKIEGIRTLLAQEKLMIAPCSKLLLFDFKIGAKFKG